MSPSQKCGVRSLNAWAGTDMSSDELVRRSGVADPPPVYDPRRASYSADEDTRGDSICHDPNSRLGAGSEEIARRPAGCSAGDLASLPEEDLQANAQAAVTRAELNRAEISQSGWKSAWRPAWMYFLGVVWFQRLIVVPPIDAFAGTALAEAMDLSAMLSLTSWFLGLYMGGHTLKMLGEAAVEAVRVAREGQRR